ncbi:hypothetical protein EJB05_52682, partial [Eragrostis curvula]
MAELIIKLSFCKCYAEHGQSHATGLFDLATTCTIKSKSTLKTQVGKACSENNPDNDDDSWLLRNDEYILHCNMDGDLDVVDKAVSCGHVGKEPDMKGMLAKRREQWCPGA